MMKVDRVAGAIILATALIGWVGCERPASVPVDRLAFLGEQARPLLLADVFGRLGSTEVGHEGPCYEYLIRGTTRRVEFWMYPPPTSVPPDLPPGGSLPIEIAMVVERSSDGQQSIIWPADLKGTDINAAKKRFWPRMY